MLDHDREAAAYDTTRGGVPRAAAAAAAVLGPLPDRPAPFSTSAAAPAR
ncbi:hypothetical protein [Streptomyces peucetius]